MADEVRCLADGELRALMDDEARDARPYWAGHVAGCKDCQRRLANIREDADLAGSLLATLSVAPRAANSDLVDQAWRRRQTASRLRTTAARESHVADGALEGDSLMNRLTGVRRRSALAGVALVALMVLVLVTAPVGTVAQDLLNRFRVQQFSAITIPMDLIQGAQAAAGSMDPQMQAQIMGAVAGLGSFSTTFDEGSLHEGSSVDDANAHVGGNLNVPSKLGSFAGVQPKVYLGDAGSAQYALNVEQARQILTTFGLDTAALPDPATTPTVTFTLNVQPSAGLVYEANGKRLLVGQTESPELSVPSSVDLDLLRDEILRTFQGLSPEVVGQLRNVKDWKHTLIVPVPANAETSDVTVDGASGLLIKSPDGSAVLWQKDGILHIVATDGADDVQAIANS